MDAYVPQCAASRRLSERRFKRLLDEHPALLLSALYVAASVVGMLFSWSFLRRFGINVFEFAQVGDFLLASLREPLTWGVVLGAIALVSLDNAASRRWARKKRSRWTRWYGSPNYRLANVGVLFVMVVVFLDAYAHTLAQSTRDGQGTDVDYVVDGETRSAILLGATGSFLFFYEPASNDVRVIPHENIAEINFAAPAAD